LVVTHEGVIKCLLYRLTEREFLPEEPPLLRPAHLHQMVLRNDGLAVDRVNALSLNGDG
jgi:probable phosphoglycerate mutase